MKIKSKPIKKILCSIFIFYKMKPEWFWITSEEFQPLSFFSSPTVLIWNFAFANDTILLYLKIAIYWHIRAFGVCYCS